MNTTTQKTYRLVKRIKSDKFSVDELHNYTLCLLIGIRDFQLCIIDSKTNTLLLLEDFRLDGIKTINARINVLKSIFDNHHLLKAGFWKSIKLALKTHKFTLVPGSHFVASSAIDYLVVTSEIKPEIEEVFHYKHTSSEAVNVFAGDRRLVKWIRSLYPNKNVTILHQGSAFIEGLLKHDDHPHDRTMFCYFDRGILHTVVTEKQKLLYYNQFAIKAVEDYLKYVLLVFKELRLQQKTTKLIMWGQLSQSSPQVALLRKYVRNVSFGERPATLNFSYHFDEIADHQFFDLLNIHLCD